MRLDHIHFYPDTEELLFGQFSFDCRFWPSSLPFPHDLLYCSAGLVA